MFMFIVNNWFPLIQVTVISSSAANCQLLWHIFLAPIIYPCFCPTYGPVMYFIEAPLAMTTLYSFFPWLGVDATVVLHLKEGPQGTHHQLDWTMVKKLKKKKKKATRNNHFSMARIRSYKLCFQSRALYTQEHGTLPTIMVHHYL